MIALLTRPLFIGIGLLFSFAGGFFTGGGVSGIGKIIKWGVGLGFLYIIAKKTDVI